MSDSSTFNDSATATATEITSLATQVDASLRLSTVDECPICLDEFSDPVTCPCGHKFCFLCIKGTAQHTEACALCRASIPEEFFKKIPMRTEANSADETTTDTPQKKVFWYYEGRNGWWEYDTRTVETLESAFQKGDDSVDVLIAGHMYHVDFKKMLQARKTDRHKVRKVKRETTNSIHAKGVAGIPSASPPSSSASSTPATDQ